MLAFLGCFVGVFFGWLVVLVFFSRTTTYLQVDTTQSFLGEGTKRILKHKKKKKSYEKEQRLSESLPWLYGWN